MSGFSFEIHYKSEDSRARLTTITTPHGKIDTPNFIFCGTKASIKGLSPAQMKECNTSIILSNTYHLMLQPGADLIAKMGGLHKFMGWDGPMFTDSGGYQIFSLGHGSVSSEIKGAGLQNRKQSLVKITKDGAEFKSYIDGRTFFLSPEESIKIQRKLGADLIVQLDECTPFHVNKDYTAKSMEMSKIWGDRSIAEWHRKDNGSQVMYGIVQGGVYPDLRKISCNYIAEQDFFGTAVGGSLGDSKEHMYEVVSYCSPYLPENRPVHLLGIGGFRDIFEGVKLGMDTFDCVSPTRLARHGWALKKGEPKDRVNIRNSKYKEDGSPIDSSCNCHCCQNYSNAYLHHLFKAGELLGMQLLSIHNVFTMNRLMAEIRQAIKDDNLNILAKDWYVI